MPGGRPTKPLALIQGHRTKAEMEVRENAEQGLLTGTPMKESKKVKADKIAHTEFRRIKKLLKSIGKDDDLYGNIINTHCLLVSECEGIEKTRELFEKNLEEFEDKSCGEDITFTEKMRIKSEMQKSIMACDKALMTKRKMILSISKENIMTVQSALRSVPKAPEEQTQSKMSAFLKKRGVGNGS